MHKLALLKDRAQMLAKARHFFSQRGILEVDCPMISRYAAVDEHIDLIPVQYMGTDRRYLHSSPEYGMKRLMVEGMGDIYQLSHVFRDGEYGRKHNPEFMMAEWYRLGFSFDQMIVETVDFIRLFLGDIPFTSMTYREVFQHFASFDYLQVTTEELRQYIQDAGIDHIHSIAGEDKDGLLNIILGLVVEPQLGRNGLFVLSHYPASQAALAQTVRYGDEHVAERFEVYFEGVELANGYHELANAQEQKKRLMEANTHREKLLGKESLPIDEHFLAALEKGLPECCGVAVGFDRLMMLRHRCLSLAEVIPFDWNLA
ncbi:EF-P lysine aminoacylase EpmA [Parachlamydia sp. AcF125]|uniref:EF-P lysine aminoacylase EpmA n=1 Tax=Parachlamydia sp. AcF125 TaxID=2795736 RepID=UPI001BC8D944|nr:EF-P lysine aminoacylase EpmA [Parachlamydia sp. AcF125]MBS4167678.1 Elongation factor P--(R)-beta-lysine ligase [Parachlamydia sp. AcF125]